MITFQRNWCISISNNNLTNLCHDRIVIFIIGHVFPPSYQSMRIHHVRGKVLQTGPKLQLTERMTDAWAWLSLFLCRSARTPKLKINRKNTQFLKEKGWNRMLNGFYCENNKKKNLFDPDLTLISSRIESNLADLVICRFSYCYSKVLINSLGGKRSTRKDLDRSNILIKMFSSKIQDGMKIIKSKWNTKEEKDERGHETSSACKDL